MNPHADFVLLVVIVLDLYIVAASRLSACVRASALQGVALSILPIVLHRSSLKLDGTHIVLMALGTLLAKALLIPFLLFRAIRQANVFREVEPFVSLHLSVLLAAGLIGSSFWLADILVLPRKPPSTLLVPIAFATVLIGFLVLVSRQKAITQVVGYLLLENGVFIFGQLLVSEIPFAVELGILLDLLVGVFVMGIAIHHIHCEFDHIDTELLSELKD